MVLASAYSSAKVTATWGSPETCLSTPLRSPPPPLLVLPPLRAHRKFAARDVLALSGCTRRTGRLERENAAPMYAVRSLPGIAIPLARLAAARRPPDTAPAPRRGSLLLPHSE